MTCLAEELAEQQRWRLRPRFAAARQFERLVYTEFDPPEEIRTRQEQRLRRLVRFAVAQVPYYAQLFAKLGLSAADIASIDSLARLPVLTRLDLLDRAADLRARRLPRGVRIAGRFSSSGSTGRRTQVLLTREANAMYTLLLQRRYRWARFDPAGLFAETRLPGMLPPRSDGTPCPPGEVLKLPRWRYVGVVFETGPYIGFTLNAPREQQLAWLREHDPAYLCAYPGVLEELAFACTDRAPCGNLRAVISIASQLMPAARRRIEQTFRVPVEEGYGLNEVGIVATRCHAGRFHIHPENCIVEIVDGEGRACRPGESGRVLVTPLTNPAMPLLRYDTDDMAEAVDGPCTCGRTLPAFTGLWGRMRRFSVLPEGTRMRFTVLSGAVASLPPDLLRPLHRYQVHQYRSGIFELRLVAPEGLPPGFEDQIRQAWHSGTGEAAESLRIVHVDDIPLGPSGKRLDFSSDFYPDLEKN